MFDFESYSQDSTMTKSSEVHVSSTAGLRSNEEKKNVLSQLLGINYLWAAQSLQSYVMNVLT